MGSGVYNIFVPKCAHELGWSIYGTTNNLTGIVGGALIAEMDPNLVRIGNIVCKRVLPPAQPLLRR